MTSMLDAALAYAARGWPVFPCWPGRKNPITTHGVLDATTDPDQIRTWWAQHPDANIAIATGEQSVDVLDIDIEPGATGYDTLAELHHAGLLDGHGTIVRTRSGGAHIYFQGTQQRSSDARGKAPIDFKATGGYVLVPPSYVEALDGKPAGTYQIISNGNPTAVLDWRMIHDFLLPPPAFTQPATGPASTTGDRAGDDYSSRTSWHDILTPHGWRQIRHLSNGTRYWCRPGKTGLFTSATTRDDGGLYVFSTSTPFNTEVPYTKFGAYTVLEHGGDYTAAAQALRTAGYGTPPPPITGPAAVTQPTLTEQETIAARYTPVNWAQAWDGQPSDVQWLVPGFLETGTVNALFAKAGTGKSLLALEISAGLARSGITVVYIDDENRVADLVERLQDMGCKPGDLDQLLVYSFAGLPALDTAAGGIHLQAIATTRKAQLVILDTTSRMVTGRENDADTFLQLYRCSLVGLKKAGITVLRLDHPGKDMTRGQRGSSAKEGDVDTIWRLEPVTGNTFRLEREKSRSGHGDPVFSLARTEDPLRHEWGIHGIDEDLIRQIAALGLSRSTGRDKIKAALHAEGIQTPNNVKLSAAINVWKVRFSPVPDPQDRSRTGGTGPDGTCPQDHELNSQNPTSDLSRTSAGQAGQVDSVPAPDDLSQPHPPVGGVADRTGAPVPDSLCTICGHPLSSWLTTRGETTHPMCEPPS
jgi:Bifunctional DNA primase/polymerase, N-terminal/AAA domain